MITEEIIESITAFVLNNKPFLNIYETYNSWAATTGHTIHDSKSAQWIIEYLADLLSIQNTSLRQDLFPTNQQE